MIILEFEKAKAQHARLLSALLLCEPDTERARELRGMMRELERDMQPLEQRRINEMAARRYRSNGAGA